MSSRWRSKFGRWPMVGCGLLCAVAALSMAAPESGPDWSRDDAAHLLRRAAFSGTPEQINRLHALGRTAAVEYLLTGALPPEAAAPFAKADLPELVIKSTAEEDAKAKQAQAALNKVRQAIKPAENARARAADAEKSRLAALKMAQSAKAAIVAKNAADAKAAAARVAAANKAAPNTTRPAASRPAGTQLSTAQTATTMPAKVVDKKIAEREAAAAKALARVQVDEENAQAALTKAVTAREAAVANLAEKNAAVKAAETTAASAAKAAQEARRRSGLVAFRNWWLDRMIRSDRPLEEKMTLFWHGLFTSGAREVRTPELMGEQNLLFHQYALGNYKALTLAMLHDPAMLRYLNNDQNLKGRPNENLARELCELFTMGEGHGYTEKDVAEIARALTGATCKNGRGMVEYTFAADQHDETPKTIFGSTGAYQPDDVVELIFARPEPMTYLARRLWEFFVYPDPSAEELAPVVEALRQSKGEVVPAVRIIFNSSAFYSPKARFALIKSPTDHLVSTVRMLDVSCGTPAELTSVGNAIASAGQVLFQPPNVRGWPGGENWITAATLYARYNAAAALVDGTLTPRMNDRPKPPPPPRPVVVAAATTSAPATGPAEVQAPAPTVAKPKANPGPRAIFTAANVSKLFAGLGPTPTREQLVDAAILRLLQRPLSPGKREALLAELGPESLTIGEPATDQRIRQLLELLMSAPNSRWSEPAQELVMDPILFSRRRFLVRGSQLLSAAATIPLFLDRSAYALADGHPGNKQTERVLVVLQLAGGNDGLNTVIPVTSDEYYKARPKIAIAKDKALKLDAEFAAHPAATGMKKLYDAGQLAILHAVGYPNPNRSHFRSTDIWTSGEPEAVVKSGWLGRYCDACCCGEDPGPGGKKKLPDAATAIALEGDPPRALIGDKYVPMAFAAPEMLGFQKAGSEAAKTAFDALNDGSAMVPNDADHTPPPGTDDTAAFLQRSALNARVYADRIRQLAAHTGAKGNYPETAFGRELRFIAQMIASDLPTRIYYAKLSGFDTHSGQTGHHDKLLADLFNTLAAFTEDLAALGHLERVLVMTFSEFGRRVKENGSGTDHGEAAPLFLAGSHLKPGFHGSSPALEPDKLHRGDVPYTTDFRSLYATILHDWMKVDDLKVLGKSFKRLEFLDV